MSKPNDQLPKPPASEQPPAPLPTVAEQVEQRRLAKAEKEKRFEEERRNRLQQAREKPDDEEDTPPAPQPNEEEEEQPPAPQPNEEEEDTPPPAPDEEEETEDEDEDEFDDFSDEDEDDDDSSNQDEDEDEDEFSDDDDEDEDPPAADESERVKTMRKRVKEQGAARKKAEARNVELEGEVETLENRVKELEDQNKHISSANVNWSTHEQITPLWEKFDSIVMEGARTFTDAEAAKQFRQDSQEALLSEYYGLTSNAKTADERIETDIQFAQTLADRYDVDDGRALVSSVKRAVEQYISIDDKVKELKQKHEEGRLSMGAEDYQKSIAPFTELLDDLGNVEADFIENNPQSVEAIVGKKYASDKDFRAAADKHKKRMEQFIFGLRPLTQTEIDKAEQRATSKGITVEEYLQTREENYQKQRMKFLNDVFYSGLVMDEFPEMRKVFDRYKAAKRKRAAAKKAVRKSKDATPPKSKEKDAPKKKAIERDYIPPSQRDFTKR